MVIVKLVLVELEWTMEIAKNVLFKIVIIVKITIKFARTVLWGIIYKQEYAMLALKDAKLVSIQSIVFNAIKDIQQ